MTNRVVWIITRDIGERSEPWKVFDNNPVAEEWVEALNKSEKSSNVRFELHGLAVLSSPPRKVRTEP